MKALENKQTSMKSNKKYNSSQAKSIEKVLVTGKSGYQGVL